MSLTPSQQALRWGIVLAAFVVLLWLLHDILTPFLVALTLAYFVDPVVDWFESKGLSRILSVVIIILLGGFLVVFLTLLVVPTIIKQLLGLIDAFPSLLEYIATLVKTYIPALDIDLANAEFWEKYSGKIETALSGVTTTLITSTQSIVGFVVSFFLIPILLFFFLLDWDKIVSKVDSWIPLDHRDTVRGIAKDIDKTLSGFLRGQGSVALIMATYYSTALALSGLNYGIALGITAGLATFVPYVGGFISGILVVGFALFEYWGDWPHFALIIVLYYGGQLVEGNFITPNIVGKSVGLHPVWIIFALSTFGSLLGFTGVLIAVPLAAVIGVLWRFFMGQYKKSRIYLGHTGYLETKTKAAPNQESL